MRRRRLIGTLAAVASILVAFVPAADAAHTGWGANLRAAGGGTIGDISCTPHAFCAVFAHGATSGYQFVTFGGSRSVHTQPIPTPLSHVGVNAKRTILTCGTPHFCLASAVRHVWTWDGTTWHRTDTAPGATGLSCAPGTQRCVVAEPDTTFLHGKHGWRTERYPSGFAGPEAVACGSARFCVAIHHFNSPDGQHNWQSAVFTGQAWKLRTDGPHFSVAELTCPTARYCLALGFANNAYRASEFTAGKWQHVPPPPGASPVYSEIACTAAHHCGVGQESVLDWWAHGTWTQHPLPDGLRMFSFACIPDGSCYAPVKDGRVLRYEHGRWAGTKTLVS